MKPKGKCKKCGIDLAHVNTMHGEEVKTFFGKKWIYYCDKCKKADFCNYVNSNPDLRLKYINTYGKLPEDVLK